MSDLIDRRATIDAMEETDWYHQNRSGEMVHGANSDEDQAWYKAEDVYEVLERMPSVQHEIIYCKDCEFYETAYCKMDVWTDDMKIYKARPNDFCSYAKRKDR